MLIISTVLVLKFVVGIFQIKKLKRRFPKQKIHGINFYNTNLPNAPFSYFRNLFWKDSILLNSDLGKQILKHEMVHIEQHSADKMLMEIVTGIFWLNPFFRRITK